ncbi:trans-sulfuration enzyme family protein [Bordetella genomosp. 13]|uniref:trans-sulfuration enzyme family protein n=1 Tax=Bordetella genomosp. 13 TaxID=463040 RepID=UPI00119CC07F
MPKDMHAPDSAFPTALLHAGRPRQGWVNTPVTRASTYVFDSVAQWRETRQRRVQERVASYGARGTDSTYALEDALVLLEGGYRAKVFPTGLAAIAMVFLAYLKSGDHVLITDGVYEPARALCAQSLSRLGITHSFYKPDGSDLARKIQPNTAMIYAENPSSLIYELMDLRAASALARKHGCLLAVDNTWGSGILHRPLALGADISIMAATKYLSGHADVMMGTVVTTQDAWQPMETAQVNYGQTVGADDAFLMLRGMRTLHVRLRAHQEHMRAVAQWLAQDPRIARVFSAERAEGAQREIYARDFAGSNGLVSVEFAPSITPARMESMIDALRYFGIGASWGGYESLVVPMNMPSARSLSSWEGRGPMCRFHIGLEDPADLIADLRQAFDAHLS